MLEKTWHAQLNKRVTIRGAIRGGGVVGGSDAGGGYRQPGFREALGIYVLRTFVFFARLKFRSSRA